MPHPLLRAAERLKLARTLGVTPDALEFLEPVPSADVRALRVATSAFLHDQHHGLFSRIAATTRLVPAAITAKLSEKVFGPLISARVAGLMPPERAVDVSSRLSVQFMAALTLELDPASAPDLLRRMPVATIVAVARELRKRSEYITMARFVDNIPEGTIRAVVDEVLDDEALVRVGFYVESEAHLTQVIGLLSPERLQATVRLTTLGPRELQEAGVVLLCKVGDPVKGRMGDAAAAAGEDLLRQLVRNVLAAEERATLEAMAANMSPENRDLARRMLS